MAEINISNLGSGGGGTLTLTTTGTGGASTYVAGVLNIPVYQGQLTLTNTGTSGAATLVGDTLNIPQYQGSITLTTTGTSGASTLVGNTLNIPNYLSSSAPAGSNGQVQFNSSGNFGASSNFNWDNTLSMLGIRTAAPGASLQINGAGATSGTSSLLINNSGASELFRVSDNGLISVGKNVSVSTQSSSQIQAVSGDAATNIVITPKGNGAFIIGAAPDGAAAGGNSRGVFAIDMQLSRTANTQVAGGNRSVLIGGQRNTVGGADAGAFVGIANTINGAIAVALGGQLNSAGGSRSAVLSGESNSSSAALSAVCGGEGNTASAQYGLAAGGFALANLWGSQAYASGRFGATGNGDAQTLNWRYRKAITGTAIDELSLDGAAISTQGRAILVANRAWNVRISVTAICSTAGGTVALGDSYIAEYIVGIKRITNTTTLIGSVQSIITAQSDASMSSSIVTITADDTNECLKIEFTPPTTAAAGTVIRVVATATATVAGY